MAVIYTGPGDPVMPVLFVPGNAGNYQQARSLASETARLWSKRTVVPGMCVHVRARACSVAMHSTATGFNSLDYS